MKQIEDFKPELKQEYKNLEKRGKDLVGKMAQSTLLTKISDCGQNTIMEDPQEITEYEIQSTFLEPTLLVKLGENFVLDSSLRNENKAHKTSVYIIQDDKGKLHTVAYRPTDPYEGRRDSDQYVLMQGLFIDNPSHNLWLGDIKCHFNYPCAWGIETLKNLTYKIVAKESYIWDYTKPYGHRQTERKVSKEFDKAFQIYQNQNKK